MTQSAIVKRILGNGYAEVHVERISACGKSCASCGSGCGDKRIISVDALNIAKAKPDFDYDLFFRTYAKFWRCQNELAVEKALVDDVHPLGFLRTNVTLAQFEEFQKTFDIQPGDGMYVAPEKRINVW